MRKGGTHFWQAPTALDLPPRGAQEAPTHSPTDQHRLTNTKAGTPPPQPSVHVMEAYFASIK